MIQVWIADTGSVPSGERKAQWESGCAWKLLWKIMDNMGVPSETPVAYGPEGKPYFPEWPEVHFNLSHSGGLAACAVSHRAVGIDIQKLRPCKKEILLHFSQKEQIYMEQYKGKEWEEAMIWLWTRKESYMKYTGKGFKLGLDSFSALGDTGECFFETRRLEQGYYVTVCGAQGEQVRWETVDEP